MCMKISKVNLYGDIKNLMSPETEQLPSICLQFVVLLVDL